MILLFFFVVFVASLEGQSAAEEDKSPSLLYQLAVHATTQLEAVASGGTTGVVHQRLKPSTPAPRPSQWLAAQMEASKREAAQQGKERGVKRDNSSKFELVKPPRLSQEWFTRVETLETGISCTEYDVAAKTSVLKILEALPNKPIWRGRKNGKEDSLYNGFVLKPLAEVTQEDLDVLLRNATELYTANYQKRRTTKSTFTSPTVEDATKKPLLDFLESLQSPDKGVFPCYIVPLKRKIAQRISESAACSQDTIRQWFLAGIEEIKKTKKGVNPIEVLLRQMDDCKEKKDLAERVLKMPVSQGALAEFHRDRAYVQVLEKIKAGELIDDAQAGQALAKAFQQQRKKATQYRQNRRDKVAAAAEAEDTAEE